MLNWKTLLLSLSTFTLIGCASQTNEVASESATESQTTEVEESKTESVTVENIDDDQSIEDEGTADNSQESDTAEDVIEISEDSSSETNVTPEVAEETSLSEPQDGKDLNIVEAVAAADSALPEDTQFLIEPLSDTLYQVEARQDGADSSVSTLLGLYQYDMDTGEILKQDPATGEFIPL